MNARFFKDSLVFTGGGTGGHFFPAVALAEGAKARLGRPVAFVGASRGIEARLLPQGSWPYLLLDVEGFLGRSPLKALRSAWKLLRGRALLLRLWRRNRPWAVVATGGYGSAPAILAAKRLGIPYFLHESNAAPGALVRRLARGAAGVWCGMDTLPAQLPGARCVLAGTPVREAFLRSFQPIGDLRPPYRLLVLGGSGGARALNEAVFEAAPALLDRYPDWDLLHQTGQGDFAPLSERPRHPRHRISPFLEFMDRQMEAACLVVTRAGASTCAELIAAGRPAVMVPLPGSAGDHQLRNAEAMAAGGRARLVPQGPGFQEALLTAALELLGDAPAREALARPEPNRAVDVCLEDLASRMGIRLD
jgi:UDP-N-acetylglucosamine--N-acetylmuramyl-(pentapeptide) pyrophosphoryl-undecaprenol N-acetylglucosamine transferase